jgi:hypothetical protein
MIGALDTAAVTISVIAILIVAAIAIKEARR